jgi:hypothetical protein
MNIEKSEPVNDRFDSREAELLRKNAIEHLDLEETTMFSPDNGQEYNPVLQLVGSVYIDEKVLNAKDLGETREELDQMTEYMQKGLQQYIKTSEYKDNGSWERGALTQERYHGVETKGDKVILNVKDLNIDLWAKEMTGEKEITKAEADNYLRGYFVGLFTDWTPDGRQIETGGPFGLLAAMAHREGKKRQEVAMKLLPVIELMRERVVKAKGNSAAFDKEATKVNIVWDKNTNHYLAL